MGTKPDHVESDQPDWPKQVESVWAGSVFAEPGQSGQSAWPDSLISVLRWAGLHIAILFRSWAWASLVHGYPIYIRGVGSHVKSSPNAILTASELIGFNFRSIPRNLRR